MTLHLGYERNDNEMSCIVLQIFISNVNQSDKNRRVDSVMQLHVINARRRANQFFSHQSVFGSLTIFD